MTESTVAKRFLLTAAVVEVSGLVTVLAALFPGPLDALIGALFVPMLEVTLDGPARLGLGIGGAVLTAWGVSMALLARALPRIDATALARALTAAAWTWFALDCTVSAVVGAWWNLLGNTAYLVVLLLPGLALRRSGSPVVAPG